MEASRVFADGALEGRGAIVTGGGTNLGKAAAAELTRLALPALRRSRGHVLFVHATPGMTAVPRWSVFVSSKAALRELGLPAGPVRPPLVDATPDQLAQLRADLAAGGVTL